MSKLCWLTQAQVEWPRPFTQTAIGKFKVDDRNGLSGIIFIQGNGLMSHKG